MLLPSWHGLPYPASPRTPGEWRRGRRRAARPLHVRLRIEELENRTLPSGFTPGPLVQVSGPDPFAGCPPPAFAFSPDSEVEPYVAVNPRNPKNMVATWTQDQYVDPLLDVFGRGAVTGVSFDGGATWQEVVIPGNTQCNGGPFEFTGDTWFSFASNGDLYHMSDSFTVTGFPLPDPEPQALLVNKSTDGGLTWGNSIAVAGSLTGLTDATIGFDKPTLTNDPHNPNLVYAVWDTLRFDPVTFNTVAVELMFRRSTDGGQTWEDPQRIFGGTDPSTATISTSPMVARPDGTLVEFFSEQVQHGSQVTTDLFVLRSRDHGQTWERRPTRVAQTLAIATTDPDTGQPITSASSATYNESSVAVDPHNGNLYAVWEDARFSNFQHNDIAFAQSTDGGRTWSAPIRINQTPQGLSAANAQAFLPAIAVADDGTIGVTYYDFRFNNARPGALTDTWFVSCHPTPGTPASHRDSWGDEIRLTAKSFDFEKAPTQGGLLFVGDYVGLAAAGNDFIPAWSQPHGTDPANVFTRRLSAREDDGQRGRATQASTQTMGIASLFPAVSPSAPGPSTISPTALPFQGADTLASTPVGTAQPIQPSSVVRRLAARRGLTEAIDDVFAQWDSKTLADAI